LERPAFAGTLDFDAPLLHDHDANGFGTGFTTRLPGTGAALQADPNMALFTAPGHELTYLDNADIQFSRP